MLIGLGLIGKERLAAIRKLNDIQNAKIDVVGYLDHAASPVGLGEIHIDQLSSLDEVIKLAPDLVFVSTPHNVGFEISLALLAAGIRVHLEKPMGRTFNEARILFEATRDNSQLTIGFNYRYMAGVRELLADCRDRRFGELISVSMILGHGGSPSDRSSWKLDPTRAGGGCLIDPGVHLLDLLCCVVNEPKPVACQTWSGFWNTGIEEEAHVALTSGKTLVQLDLSVVRWRSAFSIEVRGVDGYGRVEGRGRSYGPQIYTRGKRWGWAEGKSQRDSEEIVCVDDCSSSFAEEISDLVGLTGSTAHFGTSEDGLRVMALHDQIRLLLT